ncbi:F-box/kelch-repeat protein At3g23880-like [Papaver somniferum]|uniref:F-box/kelch-repeat protein At3g23880-like n=1 Tax=Papaver somniferum TaxID=3469 RepID=UPI000E6FE5C5|nr:F-box/kelch-repeat protein At3g23880-like [Papaver somniferum]
MDIKRSSEMMICTASINHLFLKISFSPSTLPEDISEEILLRLPVKSLLRFKSVGKSFYSLIRSPNFVNKHNNRNIQKNNITLIYHNYGCPPTFTAQTISLKSSLLFPSTECHSVYSFIHLRWEIDSFCGSCDGLVCVSCITNELNYYNFEELIVILNPSTTEFKEIHIPQKLSENWSIKLTSLFWFGYDYKIADYKLVRVVDFDRSRKQSFEVEVYTLGAGLWRKIENVPYIFEKHQPGVLVNGALHWFVVSSMKQVEVLVSFDITNERFVEVSLPEERLTYPEDFKCDKKLGELGGCLCLLFHVFCVRVDVWVMQEYGVRESWTKSFTINGDTVTRSLYLSLEWSFSNNKILLHCDDKLILYDPKNGRYRKLAVVQIDTCTDAVKYVASHVSLNSGRYLMQSWKEKNQSKA